MAATADRPIGNAAPPRRPPPGVVTERGCLALADISGYTSYLVASELTHAEDTLADLTETVVEALSGSFRLAKLEGDAAFAYLTAAQLDATTVFDTVSVTYRAFRNRLASIKLATTCDCNACVLVPNLDLKLVLHAGEYIRRQVAGSEELTGVDVILVHRLLKNHVVESLGHRAYALYTDACVAALGLEPAVLGMEPYRESFEGVGEVPGWVDDLEARRKSEANRFRIRVDATAPGAVSVELSYDAPPEQVWEFLTVPERRVIWTQDLLRVEQSTAGGVRGMGTTSHCVHGRETILEEIVDWRPFESFTVKSRQPQPLVPSVFITFDLEQTKSGGTRGRVLVAPEPGARNALVWRAIRGLFEKAFRQGAESLRAALAEDHGAAVQS